MRTTRRALAAVLGATAEARAQATYPDRPVTLVAPFSPGGASDVAARTLAAAAQRLLGQSVVVENRTGASGAIGSLHVARARPDGYTLLLARIGSAAVLPATDPRAPYGWDEFTMLGLLDENPYVFAVRADAPQRTLAELVTAVRAAPGRLAFSTAGAATVLDLGVRYLLLQAGLPVDAALAVPIRGGGEATTALLSGQVQFMGTNLVELAAQLGPGGGLRALAVSTRERFPTVAEVPTVREAGFPELERIVGWNALFGPPGLPEGVAGVWTRLLSRLSEDAEWLAATRRAGAVPRVLPPAATRAYVGEQVELYRELARRLGLS